MIRDLSIRYKIILMVMAIFIIIFGLSYTIFSISESQKQKRGLEREALFLARFAADYCSAPLSFGIKEETTEALNNLQSSTSVIYAAVYDINGKIFDSYNPHSLTIPESIESPYGADSIATIRFGNNLRFNEKKGLIVKLSINYQNEQYGTILLTYSMNQAKMSLRKNMRTAALIVLVFLVVAYLLALLFQKIISEPILALASVTERITQDAKYSIRLNKRNNDEIGILYDRFNNMLEQIEFRDKNRDQTEEILKEAKKLAEKADKLKSAFLANMSHEIRTPMNSIIGFAGLLGDPEISNEERTEYVELINSSCNTLLHLIDDILDISKIEAGQVKISIEKYPVPVAMHELYLAFKETNYQNNGDKVELKLNIPTTLSNLVIYTDFFRLKQILSNLITNAIKFTHEGHIEIGFTLIEKIKDEGRKKYVKFFIHDTGIGMAPETCDVIFDRFTKIESDNNKLYRGAGLGLTISKKLVELLNGEIWVDSEINKGSSFYFIIPANTEFDDLDEFEADRRKKEEIFNIEIFKNKTILIVEDDVLNFELLKAIFKKTDANVAWSRNGIEAIEYCKTSTPDIILMDIKMPDMDGYQTFSHLKGLNINSPIIAQTAFAGIDDENKILSYGFDAYFAKPIEKEKLLNTIIKIFTEG